MNSEQRLRELLEESAGLPEAEPLDWEATLRRAHRRLALRQAVVIAAAVLGTAVLLVGGLLARAELSGEEQDQVAQPAGQERPGGGPAQTEPRGERRGDTKTAATTATLPDLTLELDPAGAIVVRNTGSAPSGAFVVVIEPSRRIASFKGLPPGEQVRRRLDCVGRQDGVVDGRGAVEESREDNNRATVECPAGKTRPPAEDPSAPPAE